MKEKIALLSVLANFILAGVKISVGFLFNSTAVLASGIDSFVDIFSSVVGYVGIKISNKPADEKHPYGHHKFEVLAGAVIAIIIFLAGISITYDAFKKFFEPQDIVISYLVFGVMIFSVVVNELMSRLKIYYGKKENSISLVSDGFHSKIDVYTSLVILIGLFFAKYWIHMDSVLAILMGIYIIKGSFSIGKEVADNLLDVSAGQEVEDKIIKICKNQNIQISSLKTQKKGSIFTANLDIKLPNNLTVEQATKISNDLRKELIQKVENLRYVAIQITSHEIETSFYKPNFGKGFGWQRRGIEKEKVDEAKREGPGGNCVCPKCGYKILHESGIPCSTLKCPKCNVSLTRE